MSIMVDKLTFASWLSDMLESHKMSQSELARRSGLSRQAINNYVFARVIDPDPASLKAIAHGLGIPHEIVYQAAGIMDPSSRKSEKVEIMAHLFDQLTQEEQQELIEIARLKLDRQKREQPSRRPPPVKPIDVPKEKPDRKEAGEIHPALSVK